MLSPKKIRVSSQIVKKISQKKQGLSKKEKEKAAKIFWSQYRDLMKRLANE
ncbi:MAG: hypothetical protein UU48_C0013G0009 [Candidatus Uhrbacteria bacterium GW2011_GWF2_41_16]|uniref:Uncharacterized protein n=2 Tax=Candidatus Uhriibacteriota TaxID=1752732 RepID=A0A0G0V978_9BACT|nr:MAG: hypothetical protein UU35_C0012G0009 [Candidatus Uhrbacteria bacterium GW2011_GWC2_41_11]KKR97519.1 MAG: hypothetical protein UU48_C0013G0009 [Candidatus Uhrbacteria bacterium GW2011_GWF2_41_16]